MSPIRLVILGILIYVGYLLIKGGSGKKKVRKSNDTDSSSNHADVLVEDPVCKKLVPKQQAVTHEHEQETIYFCSEECCKTFISEKGATQ